VGCLTGPYYVRMGRLLLCLCCHGDEAGTLSVTISSAFLALLARSICSAHDWLAIWYLLSSLGRLLSVVVHLLCNISTRAKYMSGLDNHLTLCAIPYDTYSTEQCTQISYAHCEHLGHLGALCLSY